MIVKKSGGKIFGADLTAAEKKALDIEARKHFAEYDRKNSNEIDAVVLWVLMSEFGFGEKRLKKFHDSFIPAVNALCERYMMEDTGDRVWLCTHMLKERGIDIEEWNK